jgi:hypothetical protein
LVELVGGGAAWEPPAVGGGLLERCWRELAGVVQPDLDVVGRDEHGHDLGRSHASLPGRVGEGSQGQVQEVGGVGLLHCAERDLDVSVGAGRQRDPAAGSSGSLLAVPQPGQ